VLSKEVIRKITKRKRTAMMYKTIRRKLKIEQHETHLKPWLNSCAPEEFVAPTATFHVQESENK
jgi:hypothetical protein